MDPTWQGSTRPTELVRSSGALAGGNASFFTFTGSAEYSGNPVGLGVYGEALLSGPTGDPAEAGLVVGAKGNKVITGHLQWTSAVQNTRAKDSLPLEYIDHPPVVSAGPVARPQPTQCAVPDDTARITPEFAATTPSDPDAEVVLAGRAASCGPRRLAARLSPRGKSAGHALWVPM